MIDISRKELKYLVSLDQMTKLKKYLGEIMKKDAYTKEEGYKVRSLYFDTLFDSDYEEKVDGYDKRQKIRLRLYDPKSEKVKLEIKEKEGTAQRKRTLLLSREEGQRMMAGDYMFLMERKEPLAHWLYSYLLKKCYRPKCIVEYDRYAFCEDTNDIRITFDMNLRATESTYDLFDENLVLYPVASSAEVTMEVKYSGFLFTYIKEMISQTERMQISNSKYCRARKITKRGRK